MNHVPHPGFPRLLPDNAPFSPEQRTWLDGFFAGLLSDGDSTVTTLSPEDSAALMNGAIGVAEGDDGAPWHDPSLALEERMKLAEGRPLRRRLMAAMGQQDCGQCGYSCEQYADAIVGAAEARLNLCVPGGKETARTLKALHQEIGAPVASPTILTPAEALPAPAGVGPSRDRPAHARLLSRTRLNKPGSAKDTWHVEFDIAGTGIEYNVGDSFGLYPSNDPALADAVLRAIDAPADFPIAGRPLRDVLIDGVSLGAAPDMLFQLISYLTGGERRQKAKLLAAGQDPDGDAAGLDVLAALEKFTGIRPDPEAFIESLDVLQPRLYSIASSPKVDRNRIALTVDTVRYKVGRRERLGVASTFLSARAALGDTMPAYVQPAHQFALPSDPSVPIIMIGPGTGVAPFRAFLQERMATKAPGRNWLFFGHQRSDFDFFYEDEFAGMKAAGVLTRLSLAWSRDNDAKFYVQDRMREVGRDLWSWIADGAHVYVCGDAKNMAKDVERALVDIAATHGVRSIDQAIAFVSELKRAGRYQSDVY